MENVEENERIIIQALGHEVRRTILKIINSSEGGISYTDLLLELRLSTGKLNYHLGQLEGFIEKNTDRNYVLTPLGKKAVDLFSVMTQKSETEYGKYFKTAKFAQRSSLHPLIRSLICILAAWGVLIAGVWCYLFYMAIMESAPLVVYVALPSLIALLVAILVWLMYALKTAPQILKRLERRLILPS